MGGLELRGGRGGDGGGWRGGRGRGGGGLGSLCRRCRRGRVCRVCGGVLAMIQIEPIEGGEGRRVIGLTDISPEPQTLFLENAGTGPAHSSIFPCRRLPEGTLRLWHEGLRRGCGGGWGRPG